MPSEFTRLGVALFLDGTPARSPEETCPTPQFFLGNSTNRRSREKYEYRDEHGLAFAAITAVAKSFKISEDEARQLLLELPLIEPAEVERKRQAEVKEPHERRQTEDHEETSPA